MQNLNLVVQLILPPPLEVRVYFVASVLPQAEQTLLVDELVQEEVESQLR